MTRNLASVGSAVFALAALVLAAPSVFPTGTTIYDPSKAWNGFTVLSPLNTQAAIVIDMNGNIVKQWDGFVNSAGGPARVLPGGVITAATGSNAPRQESLALVQQNFDGKEMWRFDHAEQIQRGEGTQWSSRQHHDWQRDDFPAGYYSPGVNPGGIPAKALILTHTNRLQPRVAPAATLEDDRILEVDSNGKILWEWIASDHIDDFKLSPVAREAIASAPGVNAARGSFDWLHVNSATYVGPNKWFDAGDQRFAPGNVIISSRQISFCAIISREGKVVWQLGPDFTTSAEMRAIGQTIGQHHAHIIPKGLPGAGNVMIFDNGGASGYGAATPTGPNGSDIFSRPTSRVLEIDPVTLKLVWSYTATTFFATNISGAQRLANGNTLITEGPGGRIFEVTNSGAIVWEYIYPAPAGNGKAANNQVYRAYRLPYEWIPQLARPSERAVTPPAPAAFRVP